ncbi:MAG: DsbE family thiol:disulfide interchange protein [Pseudomonadales bacterium]|jgi:cytochrome c biogenesis protein CcmG/thiol:disulfide interchange protein DsbE|nr:DsbE family thiol:disulfide interchange protein [Pseudomonadales bacterium]MCP5332652.1 DsbE family thiol:disulfide interchange protein [Pseudomonadales bacterium]HNH20011.1 DsbE family thiol:disulfide interchange protein [Pseudomonadales bacterium]HNL23971.1 DsbE family thiol:disulfide interchange protein [Pseudomonadales bacterium]HNL31979.1 DsbE family thiol:disulfide interchange protein [Pseudomonadales bacterium]
MTRWKLFIPLLLFLALGAFLLRGLFMDPTLLPSPLIGKPLPAFTLGTLADPAGVKRQSDLTGEVALVNVWATWCISCRAEHPWLMKIAAMGVPIYGVNYKDQREAALTWLKQLGDPYRFSLFDENGRLGLDLGVYGAPESYLIDRHGVIRYKRVGVIDERIWRDELEPAINRLRAEP